MAVSDLEIGGCPFAGVRRIRATIGGLFRALFFFGNFQLFLSQQAQVQLNACRCMQLSTGIWRGNISARIRMFSGVLDFTDAGLSENG